MKYWQGVLHSYFRVVILWEKYYCPQCNQYLNTEGGMNVLIEHLKCFHPYVFKSKVRSAKA